jgi:predicted PurR-regulated permease PerM
MNLPPPTQWQARIIWIALTGLAIALLVILAAGLVWGLGQVLNILSPVVWPLAVAGILAYLLDPVVDFIERRGASRPRAIVAVFALALVIMAALLGSVVPQVITETRQLADRVPDYVDWVQKRSEKWINNPPAWLQKVIQHGSEPHAALATNEVSVAASTPVPPAGTNAPPLFAGAFDATNLQTAAGLLAKGLHSAGSWFVGRLALWFGVIAGLALIPIYTFYFLLEKRGISSRWTDYLPVADSSFKQELVFVLNSINNYLIAFFRGQVLVAICDGILYGIGFLIIGLPYAVLISVAAIFLTIIPFLGAIIIFIIALLISFVQFGDWRHPLLVLGVFVVVQALEGLVISPKIMAGRVGLHPLSIIISVMVGTTLLGGILGGILAIPLAAVLRVVMSRYVWKRPAGA